MSLMHTYTISSLARLLFLLTFSFFGSSAFANTSAEDIELRQHIKALTNLYSDGLAVAHDKFVHIKRAPLFDNSGEDAIVLFSLEGFRGGNDHAEYIAVFASVQQEKWAQNRQHRFRLVGVQEIGGRWWRTFDDKSLSIQGKVITLNGNQWTSDDSGCCPSKTITQSFVVTDRGVIERQ